MEYSVHEQEAQLQRVEAELTPLFASYDALLADLVAPTFRWD